MPTILLKGGKQRAIADVLSLPQDDGKGEGLDEIEQVEQLFGRDSVGRIRGECGGGGLQASSYFVFERGRVEIYFAGDGFAKQALDVVGVKFGTIELLFQLAIHGDLG